MTPGGFEPGYAELYALINFFCILIHMIVLIRSFVDMNGLHKAGTYRAAIVFSMLMCLSDTVFTLCTHQDHVYIAPAFLLALKTAYFLSNEMMCICWFFYFESQQHLIRNRQWIISCLPLIMALILLAANSYTGILFYLDHHLIYQRGPFFTLLYLLSYCYVLYFSIGAFIRSFRDENYGNRDVYRTIALFPVLPAVCGIIQFFAPALPVLCGGMSCIILIHYMTQLRVLISRDPLTGMNNRRYFLNQLSQELKNHKNDGHLALVMIDIDLFKEINDRFGHDEGDKALCLMAEALKKTASQYRKYCLVARYGGDEFMALTKVNAQKEIFDFEHLLVRNITDLQKNNDLYQVSISFGHAFNDTGMTLKTMIQESDQAMYNEKAAHHQEKE